MKRAAIIGMASFYLLLSTGMFVCILHCSAERLLAKPEMYKATTDMCKSSAKKPCGSGNGCDCCKKHGSYVIKENLKPGFEIQFAQTAMTIQRPSMILYSGSFAEANYSSLRTDGKAPPGKSGKLLSIQYHSLQI